MATSIKTPHGYIPGIDGLRAVAVLSVLLFHMRGSFLPGGFAGVDVFFVISGYVVSASLVHRYDNHIGRYLLAFYARRIVRIFPALLVCVLLTGLATTMLVPASWLSQTTAYTGLASIFGLSNFALVWFSDGYFSPRAEFNPFTHTWSLAVEEQFYLVFPVMFYAWFRARAGGGGAGGDLGALAGRLALPAALLGSLGYCAYASSARADLAYYMLPSRFWELASGALLFRLHHAGRALPANPRQAGLWTIAGSVLIGLAFAFADPRKFPYPWALAAVLGAVLVIGGSVGDVARRAWPNALFGSRAMTYVGKISYSLYLWHWPVLVLLRWTTGLESVTALVIAVVLAFGLAMVSYHSVEHGAWWRRSVSGWEPGRTAAYGGVGLVVCAVCLGAVLKSQPWTSLSVTRESRTWYPNASPARAVALTSPGSAMAGRKVFVWGDSHAGAYSTMLQETRERTGAQVFTLSRGGCAIAGLQSPASAACADRIDATIAEIKSKAAAGDIVFLASLRVPRLADQWEAFQAATPTLASRPQPSLSARQIESINEAHLIVTALEQAGLQVIIDAPKPIFKSPPFRCSDWFNAHNPICAGGFVLERAFLEAHRKPTMDALAQLKGLHPALEVWDPLPVLCPGSSCSAFDEGRPLFFDGDHLSGHGNRVLLPAFLSMLTAVAQRQPAPKPS